MKKLDINDASWDKIYAAFRHIGLRRSAPREWTTRLDELSIALFNLTSYDISRQFVDPNLSFLGSSQSMTYTLERELEVLMKLKQSNKHETDEEM